MLYALGRVRISTLRNENETFSQLNSITYIGVFFAFGDLFAPSLAKAKKSAQKILEKKSVSADTASAGCAYFRPMDSHPLRDGENELAALQQSK